MFDVTDNGISGKRQPQPHGGWHDVEVRLPDGSHFGKFVDVGRRVRCQDFDPDGRRTNNELTSCDWSNHFIPSSHYLLGVTPVSGDSWVTFHEHRRTDFKRTSEPRGRNCRHLKTERQFTNLALDNDDSFTFIYLFGEIDSKRVELIFACSGK